MTVVRKLPQAAGEFEDRGEGMTVRSVLPVQEKVMDAANSSQVASTEGYYPLDFPRRKI